MNMKIYPHRNYFTINDIVSSVRRILQNLHLSYSLSITCSYVPKDTGQMCSTPTSYSRGPGLNLDLETGYSELLVVSSSFPGKRRISTSN
jgi:hypothetical protein